MNSRRRWLLAVLTAVALVAPLPAAATDDPVGWRAKLDPAFVRELAADGGRSYFDVLVVFDDARSRAVLDELGRPVRHYRHFPISRVLLRQAEIAALVDRASVLFVELNTASLRLQNEEGRRIVRADDLQEPAVPAADALTGAGVHVAVVDSPIDGTHPALRDRIERNWVIGGTTPEWSQSDGSASAAPTDDRVYVSATPDGIEVTETFVDAGTHRLPVPAAGADTSGHGTHVAGTIAGDGAHDDGVAPGARLHGYGFATAGPQILLSYLVEAYDHLLGDDRIRIVNASVGVPGCDAGLFWLHRPNFVIMRIAALEHGVLTVNSYGNFGASKSNAQSGCGSGTESVTLSLQPYVLGVGAVSKGRRLWPGSSRGIAGGNVDRGAAMDNLEELLDSSPVVQAQWDLGRRPISLHRPAVVAPGVRIVSTQRADHDYQLLSMAGDPDPLYGVRTGTSMAAPHAAGVAALMVEAYRRNHRGTDPSPLDLIGALELSADRSVVYDSDARDAGAGLVDAVAAVRLTRRSPVASAQKDPDLEPVHRALTTTRGGILRGTLDVPSVALTAGTALAPASVHEVSVPAGTWLLSAQVVDAPANAFEVSLYPPGAPRPAVQSADNYAPRSTTTPRPAVAFPSPGTWTIRVERSATTPPGPFAVEWKTEAPPA